MQAVSESCWGHWGYYVGVGVGSGRAAMACLESLRGGLLELDPTGEG